MRKLAKFSVVANLTYLFIAVCASPLMAENHSKKDPKKDSLGDVLNILENAPAQGGAQPPGEAEGSGIDVVKLMERSGTETPKDPEDVARLFAATVGISENSRFYKTLRDSVYDSLNNPEGSGKVAAEQQQEETPKVLNVVAHFRGDSGIPFPTEEEMPQMPDPTQEQLQNVVDDYQKISAQYLPQEFTPVALKKCTGDKVDKIDLGYSGEHEKDVVFDMLFISPESMPKDPDEAFGKETSIRVYDPENDPNYALAILSMGVDCLPYRIRATNKFRFVHTGASALRNYDKDSHGSGFVFASMKEKKK